MRFKSPEFVPPENRLLELAVFANTEKLGPLFRRAPDVASGALSPRDFERLHERVVADLTAIAGGYPLPDPKRLVEHYRSYSCHGEGYTFEDRQFWLRYEFPTLEAQTSFLTLLLHSNVGNPAFPGDLSRCKYDSSGEASIATHPFFYATKRKPSGERGPKPRTYCCDEHREAALVSTPRVLKHRAKHK